MLQLGATAGVRGVFLAGVALSAIFSRKATRHQYHPFTEDLSTKCTHVADTLGTSPD